MSTLVEKFISKIRPRGSGCWEWTGSKDTGGYGMVWRGRHIRTSRLAWALFNGADPGKCCVLHKCDNRACCNPAHLFLGDHGDNARDMVSKGRHKPARGSANPTSKLTEEIVRRLRRIPLPRGLLPILARHYGVSKQCIWLAAKGRTWKHVS